VHTNLIRHNEKYTNGGEIGLLRKLVRLIMNDLDRVMEEKKIFLWLSLNSMLIQPSVS